MSASSDFVITAGKISDECRKIHPSFIARRSPPDLDRALILGGGSGRQCPAVFIVSNKCGHFTRIPARVFACIRGQ